MSTFEKEVEVVIPREMLMPVFIGMHKEGLGDLAIGMTDGFCSSVFPTEKQMTFLENHQVVVLDKILH